MKKTISERLREAILYVKGFRLTAWEIRQMILAEFAEVDWQLVYGHKDYSLEMQIENLHEMNDVFGYAHYLGLFHFMRGYKLLLQRDPSKSVKLLKIIDILGNGKPYKNKRSIVNHDYFKQHQWAIIDATRQVANEHVAAANRKLHGKLPENNEFVVASI